MAGLLSTKSLRGQTRALSESRRELSLAPLTQALVQSWQALLFPSRCIQCATPTHGQSRWWICAPCLATVVRLPHLRCARCEQHPPLADTECCLECAQRPSPLISCHSSASFSGLTAEQVHRFKYPPVGPGGIDPGPKRFLTALLLEASYRAPADPTVRVIPVPLHPVRLRERGFNHAAVLAKALAKTRDLAYLSTALERTRNTSSQTNLGRAERLRNMRDAFGWCERPPSPRSVWLVDDVVTTGATLEAAARAIRKAGVQEITAICVARTPLDRSRD